MIKMKHLLPTRQIFQLKIVLVSGTFFIKHLIAVPTFLGAFFKTLGVAMIIGSLLKVWYVRQLNSIQKNQ